MKLVYKGTNKEVKVGDIVTPSIYFEKPRCSSSSGRVLVSFDDNCNYTSME